MKNRELVNEVDKTYDDNNYQTLSLPNNVNDSGVIEVRFTPMTIEMINKKKEHGIEAYKTIEESFLNFNQVNDIRKNGFITPETLIRGVGEHIREDYCVSDDFTEELAPYFDSYKHAIISSLTLYQFKETDTIDDIIRYVMENRIFLDFLETLPEDIRVPSNKEDPNIYISNENDLIMEAKIIIYNGIGAASWCDPSFDNILMINV